MGADMSDTSPGFATEPEERSVLRASGQAYECDGMLVIWAGEASEDGSRVTTKSNLTL
jgi:hypothetical protein